MTWGISPSLVTKSDLEEVGRFHSFDLEKAAYRLSISSYTKPPTMQKETESRSLPVPFFASLFDESFSHAE